MVQALLPKAANSVFLSTTFNTLTECLTLMAVYHDNFMWNTNLFKIQNKLRKWESAAASSLRCMKTKVPFIFDCEENVV